MKTTTLAKTLLATGIAAGLGFSQTTMAQNPTASDELEVEVELAAGLTLVCGTLNFGTINVELGDRASTNTVTVDRDGSASISGSGNAALGGNATAAECKITGISGADTTITASSADLSSSPMALSGAQSTDGGPTTDYTAGSGTLLVELDVFDDSASTTADQADWDGTDYVVYSGTTDTEHSFYIGGDLEISATDFEADNMGKYVNSVTIVVEEEDTAT